MDSTLLRFFITISNSHKVALILVKLEEFNFSFICALTKSLKQQFDRERNNITQLYDCNAMDKSK